MWRKGAPDYLTPNLEALDRVTEKWEDDYPKIRMMIRKLLKDHRYPQMEWTMRSLQLWTNGNRQPVQRAKNEPRSTSAQILYSIHHNELQWVTVNYCAVKYCQLLWNTVDEKLSHNLSLVFNDLMIRSVAGFRQEYHVIIQWINAGYQNIELVLTFWYWFSTNSTI